MMDVKATTSTALAHVRLFSRHVHDPQLDLGWIFAAAHTSTIFDSDGSMHRICHENAVEVKGYFGNGFDAVMWT